MQMKLRVFSNGGDGGGGDGGGDDSGSGGVSGEKIV